MGRLPSGRVLAAAGALLITATVVALIAIGLSEPAPWSTSVWVGGFTAQGHVIRLPPFPVFSDMEVFNLNVQSGGRHFYVLGSDAGGRDLLALIARGAPPSLGLVALVVLARLTVGFVIGVAIGLGNAALRVLSRGMGRWVIGFPYLALAIITIQAFPRSARVPAFVAGMGLVGWREVSDLVAERIEHVRAQPFTLAARALGTEGLTFFRLHVVPHLRPALAVEIPFQASAVLVLLAELGFLQVYLNGGTALLDVGQGGASFVSSVLVNQPELGQLLAGARIYILQRQFEPVVMPALMIAVMALAFELLGVALRGRARS